MYIVFEESVFGVGFFECLEVNVKFMLLICGLDVWDVFELIKWNVFNILNIWIGGV